jgi:hypothetical protein
MSDRQKTRINIGRNACLFNAKKSENNCCAFVGGVVIVACRQKQMETK